MPIEDIKEGDLMMQKCRCKVLLLVILVVTSDLSSRESRSFFVVSAFCLLPSNWRRVRKAELRIERPRDVASWTHRSVAVKTAAAATLTQTERRTTDQQYSSRKVASRKSQLLWIAQAVRKIQARESRKTANETNSNAVIDQRLVEALTLLYQARTQQQVLEAGRLLSSIDIANTQVLPVQERVVKAASMTGLIQFATALTDTMLAKNHLPSEICQDALCDTLRRAGRLGRLQEMLLQFGSVASPQQQQISTVAFNTYLAALCDVVTGKDLAITTQQLHGTDITSLSSTNSRQTEALEEAWKWLRDPADTRRRMAVSPDPISYATVIQAAASVGNRTLVDLIWGEMRTQNIQPNICAYNARLRTVSTSSSRNTLGQGSRLMGEKRDREMLQVWDNEIARDEHVKPDKYSIDLILLPLIRAGRVGDVECLLDTFVKRNSSKVVSNAFTAFLLTIVGGGELSTARALFETYILPTLAPVVESDAGGMIRMVRPATRHFNVLLEGYRKQAHNGNEANRNAASEEGWSMYRLMINSQGIRADPYTITSMMGLCRTPTELSDLLHYAVSDLDIEISSVVLHAASKCMNLESLRENGRGRLRSG